MHCKSFLHTGLKLQDHAKFSEKEGKTGAVIITGVGLKNSHNYWNHRNPLEK